MWVGRETLVGHLRPALQASQAVSQRSQEPGALGAVDDAMVCRQRERHLGPDPNLPLVHEGPFTDLSDGQQRTLGGIDQTTELTDPMRWTLETPPLEPAPGAG